MATDTTGFRSLVQQIQERDRSPEPTTAERERPPMRETRDARPPREAREPREPRRDLPRRTRGRSDGMNVELSNKAKPEADGTLLGRRWL